MLGTKIMGVLGKGLSLLDRDRVMLKKAVLEEVLGLKSALPADTRKGQHLRNGRSEE